MDDPGRVGQIDDQRSWCHRRDVVPGGGQRRKRPQGVCEAARSDRLLARQPEGSREGFVEDAGVEAADPDLIQHDVGLVEGTPSIGLHRYDEGRASRAGADPKLRGHKLQFLCGSPDEGDLEGRSTVEPARPVGERVGQLRRAAPAAAEDDEAHHPAP